MSNTLCQLCGEVLGPSEREFHGICGKAVEEDPGFKGLKAFFAAKFDHLTKALGSNREADRAAARELVVRELRAKIDAGRQARTEAAVPTKRIDDGRADALAQIRAAWGLSEVRDIR